MFRLIAAAVATVGLGTAAADAVFFTNGAGRLLDTFDDQSLALAAFAGAAVGYGFLGTKRS